MYEEQGGCPSGGTVAVMAYGNDRQCVVVANDQTVKAGAWFPIACKKNLRMQEIAMENHLPIIYLVDSAGVFLPMQDEIFPDKEHFSPHLFAIKCAHERNGHNANSCGDGRLRWPAVHTCLL